MASAGIKGTMAGTALRNIFTRISTNAGATSKTLGALDIITDKLGISFYDANGEMRDWSDILVESRAAWKGLSLWEQIYYAKQIASLRGMTGWLALMNASKEDFERVQTSLEYAAGAAQLMADTRLDNLWGDTVKFNAALDVLKVALYDDMKGPMREITQYGTQSLQRITDAVNERGLTGGIEQLGTEIESLSELVSPMLQSIGSALVPVVSTLINTLLPTIIPAAYELGRAFVGGIISGIVSTTSESSSPIVRWLSSYLGGSFDQGYLGFGDSLLNMAEEASSLIKIAPEGLLGRIRSGGGTASSSGGGRRYSRSGGGKASSGGGGGRFTDSNDVDAISSATETGAKQGVIDGLKGATINVAINVGNMMRGLNLYNRNISLGMGGGR